MSPPPGPSLGIAGKALPPVSPFTHPSPSPSLSEITLFICGLHDYYLIPLYIPREYSMRAGVWSIFFCMGSPALCLAFGIKSFIQQVVCEACSGLDAVLEARDAEINSQTRSLLPRECVFNRKIQQSFLFPCPAPRPRALTFSCATCTLHNTNVHSSTSPACLILCSRTQWPSSHCSLKRNWSKWKGQVSMGWRNLSKASLDQREGNKRG